MRGIHQDRAGNTAWIKSRVNTRVQTRRANDQRGDTDRERQPAGAGCATPATFLEIRPYVAPPDTGSVKPACAGAPRNGSLDFRPTVTGGTGSRIHQLAYLPKGLATPPAP